MLVVVTCVFLFLRLPTRSTRTNTLFPYPTLFQSEAVDPGFRQGPEIGIALDCPIIGAPHARAVERGVVAEADAHRHQREGDGKAEEDDDDEDRSEEHTSELLSLMRIQ